MTPKRRNFLVLGVLLLGLLLVSSTSVYAAHSQTFAYINISGGWDPSGENITVLENNWVELQGGVEVTIPKLTFVYNGFNKADYTENGREVNITINVGEYTDHKVEYPYLTHQVFYDDIDIKVRLSTSVAGVVYYNISKTYPTQARDIADGLVHGNTTQFRDLFSNHSIRSGTIGSTWQDIGTLPAGDYMMIVTDKPLSESDFGIISATWIEVLEYKSQLTAPSSIEENIDLEVTMDIIGAPAANYRYGGALIKREDYVKPHDIRLESDATRDGTKITVDSVSFVENWKIAGVGLTHINAAKIQDKILAIIAQGGYEGAVYYPDITSSTSQTLLFTTDDLPLGRYVLSVGVWQVGSNKLVAFSQTEIIVTSAKAKKDVEAKGAETGSVVTGSVSFTDPGINETLTSINFMNTTLTGTINVSSYATNPSTVPPDATKIKTPVGYLVVEVPTGWENEPAVIHFKVNLAELTAAGIDKTEVKLYKLVDSTWVELPTTYDGDVDGYATYTATIPSWSIFAIATAMAAIPLPAVGVRGAAAPPAPVMNVPVDPETGEVTSITMLAVDGATLTIPKGTSIKDAEGAPLSTSIITLYAPTTAERVGSIVAYEFGPSGTTFEPPIDLVIAYDPADIPEGFSESDLVIRMWDGTAWIDLETTVDTVAHMATAKVSHFTIFVLFAVAAPPVVLTPTPTPVVTPTPPPPVTPIPTSVPPFPVIPLVVVIVLVVAVIIVAVAYVVVRRKP